MTEQPAWFRQLQYNLNAPVMVQDGAVIDWDQCRDRFLVPLLQRLETRTSSPHPAIVRSLLEKRLAGDDVTAQLSAACAAALVAGTAGFRQAQAAATATAALAAGIDVATTAAAAAAAAGTAVESTAQLLDLQAAIAASAQPPSADQPLLPDEVEVTLSGPGIWSVCSDPSGIVLTQQLAPAEEAVRLLRPDPAPVSQPPAPGDAERLQIMAAGIRYGYLAGHEDTVDGHYADPDAVAADYAPEILKELALKRPTQREAIDL